MERMKYVIVSYAGAEIPIIFSELIDHNMVVPSNANAVSAGRIEFGVVGRSVSNPDPCIEVNCFGFSTSLNLKSRGLTDTQIIRAEIERASW